MANNKNQQPSINADSSKKRMGPPFKLDIMRELASDIGYEPVDFKTDPYARSRVEAILRDWATSSELRKQLAFMRYGFGRPPKGTLAKPKVKKPIVTESKNGNLTIIEWPEDTESEDA